MALLALAPLGACTDLPALSPGVCGNGIVEPALGEDCDGPTDPLCGQAEDVTLACRRLCDFSADRACAVGSACGNDGVCHVASSVVASLSERAWVSADTLVFDANADGVADVIGVSNQRVDVALGAGGGELVATTTLPGQYVTGAAAVGDPTGDGLLDVIIPTPVGVLTMAGDPIDALVPVAQSSFAIPTTGRMLARTVEVLGAAGLVTVFDNTPGRGVMLLDSVPGAEQVIPFPLNRSVDDVVGNELLFYGQRLNPLLELEGVMVIPFETDLWLLRVTQLDDEHVGVEEIGLVGMSAAATGCGKIRSVSIHRLDLTSPGDLVVTTSSLASRNCILYMLDQPITNTQAVRGFVGTSLNVLWSEPALGANSIQPLAVDDPFEAEVLIGTQNLPRQLSVIAGTRELRYLICDGNGTVGCFLGPTPIRTHVRAWDTARFVDINDPGRTSRPEIIGYTHGEPNVEVFLPTTISDFPVYNDASITTSAPVRDVIFGEFDGDLVQDLAIVTGERIDGQVPDDALYVAYGRDHTSPSGAELVAKLGDLIAVTPITTAVAGEIDATTDLLVIADRGFAGDPVTRGGAILLGSTSRRMVAPLLLPGDSGVQTPIAIAAMNLDDRRGEDLIVLGSGRAGFQAMPYSPNGFTMELLSEAPIPFDADPFEADTALWTTVAATGARRIAASADKNGRVVSVTFDCATSSTTMCSPMPTIARLSPDLVLPPVSALRSGDVDGDGDADLIGVFDTRGQGRARVVLWADNGTSGLGATAVQDFSLGTRVFDAVATDIDVDGDRDLIMATREGLMRSERVGGTWSEPAMFVPLEDGAAPAVFVEAAELNGDGLIDFVITTGADRRHPTALQTLLQFEERASFAEVQ